MRELDKLLEKISVPGRENRFNEIVNILKSKEIDFIIQENENNNYSRPFKKTDEEKEWDEFYEEYIEENFNEDEEEVDENEDDDLSSLFKNSIFNFYSNTKNIIVNLKDFCTTDREEKIVIMAHYDSFSTSTAANDNGSSIAILISFIEHVILKGTDKWFEIVFTDKEESGGLGCKLYFNNNTDFIDEVINLDTCGVGNKIVVCDYSKHIFDSTSILKEKNIMDKFNVVETDILPYCDSNFLIENEIDTITICTFPDEDIDIIKGFRFYGNDKKKILDNYNSKEERNLLYRYSSLISPKFYKMDIFNYMHCGKYDDIKYINYNVMNNILDYLLLII